MLNESIFLIPDLQLNFHHKLKEIKELYFHEALKSTIERCEIQDIDKELNEFVPGDSLKRLASFSIRGEAYFPIPILLKNNPFLLGYYRLLLGFSQKEFYSGSYFLRFKSFEEKGIIPAKSINDLAVLCSSLIKSVNYLITSIDELSISSIKELQLLTVGPQLRGSRNNEYGATATLETFDIIKALVKNYILTSSQRSIKLKNDSNRIVNIAFSPDPDIQITEEMSMGKRGLVSIEIKGGKDISNIHNRIGEAEKSHQKAKQAGYFEFITIVNVEVEYAVLKNESPTSSYFFKLDNLKNIESTEFHIFKDILSSMMSIQIK